MEGDDVAIGINTCDTFNVGEYAELLLYNDGSFV